MLPSRPHKGSPHGHAKQVRWVIGGSFVIRHSRVQGFAMLTFGTSRRDFLRVGGLGLGGLTLPDLLRLKAAQPPERTREKAVIFVYLFGGPSHVDTFDMKP